MKKLREMKYYAIILLFLMAQQAISQLNKETGNNESDVVVQTKNGLLRGKSNAEVASFKGIPYAAPPVGQFRWRPPQPVKPWEGIRDASKYGANCAQSGWGAAPGTIADNSSEDCLYLNLWKPANAKPEEKLPVMVWIHGGGFTGGSGSGPQDFGDQFAKQNVILLTINYRIGRLGFFAFPALNQEYPEEPKGNYGFMDQIAALEWVQKNIAAFGGDPNNVTIFGFSAGGVSVHTLLTIPAAKGLFHKAISQSGGGRDGVLTGRPISKENADVIYAVSAETIGVNFAKKIGIEGTGIDALAKLRALSVEKIVDGGQQTDGPNGPRTYSGPILDGKLVIETAETAYKAGRQAKVPLIIGANSAEIGGGFVNQSKSKEELFSLFGILKNEAKKAYDPEGDKNFEEVVTQFNTDWVWAEPARMTAKAFAKNNTAAYYYLFSYVPASMRERMRFGAGHGSEVAYVFDNFSARRGNAEITPEQKNVAKIMNTYWANFAKTGNPNGEGLSKWPLYNQKNEILEIETDGKPVDKPDPRKARLDVIEKASELKGLQLQTQGI